VACAEVDEFLRAYVHPVLKAAGFRRKGRELSIIGPDGRIGFVHITSYNLPQAPGFYCAYGMVTPAHLAWWEGRGVSSSSGPLLGLALVMVQLLAPDPERSLGSAGSHDWWGLYRDSDLADMGERIGANLRDQVIPDLNSWFDPAALADDIARRRDDVIPLMNPWPRAEAMAFLDVVGGQERVERALALLPPGDMVREWTEARLAARPAG
jgi:hypothetical protein